MSRLFDNGSEQYLQIDSTPITDYPFTLACWMYPDNVTDDNGLVFVGDLSEGNQYIMTRADGGDTNDPVIAMSYNGSDGIGTSERISYIANTWQLVVGVFSNDTSRTVYLDNNAGTEDTTDIDCPADLNRMAIGAARDNSPGRYMGGRIAEVGIWSVALSPENIALLASKDAPSIVDASNLECYWPLIDDDDDDKGGYNMTAYNSPTFTDHVPGMNYGGGGGISMPLVMLQHDHFGGGII